jgi:hypothetical protein
MGYPAAKGYWMTSLRRMLSAIVLCGLYGLGGPCYAQSGVANPLKPTDKLTIKVQKLETSAELKESGRILVSARLLLCIEIDSQENCRPLGTTGAMEVQPGQSKDFEGENRKSKADLYSAVIPAPDIGEKLTALPSGHTYGPPYLKIELRKNIVPEGSLPTSVDVKDSTVIGFSLANFPEVTEMSQREDKVLTKHVVMALAPDKAQYGAEILVLVQRKY